MTELITTVSDNEAKLLYKKFAVKGNDLSAPNWAISELSQNHKPHYYLKLKDLNKVFINYLQSLLALDNKKINSEVSKVSLVNLFNNLSSDSKNYLCHYWRIHYKNEDLEAKEEEYILILIKKLLQMFDEFSEKFKHENINISNICFDNKDALLLTLRLSLIEAIHVLEIKKFYPTLIDSVNWVNWPVIPYEMLVLQ